MQRLWIGPVTSDRIAQAKLKDHSEFEFQHGTERFGVGTEHLYHDDRKPTWDDVYDILGER